MPPLFASHLYGRAASVGPTEHFVQNAMQVVALMLPWFAWLWPDRAMRVRSGNDDCRLAGAVRGDATMPPIL